MAPLIVLVMAEHSADDSPLWYRGSRELVGLAEAADLGLSASLRLDLRAWNDVFERASIGVLDDRDEARPPGSRARVPSEVLAAHRVDAFTLASRLQLELGDDAHVWCGAGDGIDTVAGSGAVVVLPSERPGTDVLVHHDGKREVLSASAAGARDGTARAIVRWRSLTERAGAPFGNAASRALGLRTAGWVQGDLGTGAQVVFLGGAAAPYRDDEVG